MKNHKLLLVSLLVCLFCYRCSVQHRRYRKGFYLTSSLGKNKIPKQTIGKVLSDLPGSYQNSPALLAVKNDSVIEPDVLFCEGSLQINDRRSVVFTPGPQAFRTLQAQTEKIEQAAATGRKPEWIGLTAFVISIASWFSTGWLALPLFALAALLSVISLRKIAAAPDRYVLKTLSLVALIISLTGLLLSAYTLVVILFS